MTLSELWRSVEEIVGYGRNEESPARSSVSLGRELAACFQTRRAQEYDVEYAGLAGVVVVVADELVHEGKPVPPALAALAVLLLEQPVLNMHGAEVWEDGVRSAREAARVSRGCGP